MGERFNHLHVHSDYSMLAGCATMEQYATVAQERGHSGIAFTEYGSMRGVSEFIKVAKEHDLKPVFGTEFYIEAFRLLMEVLGPVSYLKVDSPDSILRSRLERNYRSLIILTFGGGTNEVQRDLIGMFGLGLPRSTR